MTCQCPRSTRRCRRGNPAKGRDAKRRPSCATDRLWSCPWSTREARPTTDARERRFRRCHRYWRRSSRPRPSSGMQGMLAPRRGPDCLPFRRTEFPRCTAMQRRTSRRFPPRAPQRLHRREGANSGERICRNRHHDKVFGLHFISPFGQERGVSRSFFPAPSLEFFRR
jgi:hypothetical protein